MADQPTPPADLLAKLRQLGHLLRQVRHLDPVARAELAGVVDELAAATEHAPLTAAEADHLSDSLAHLTQALRQPHDAGLLEAAKERLGGTPRPPPGGAP